jgi:hypothetical protein
VFIGIPKTGTQSISQVLSLYEKMSPIEISDRANKKGYHQPFYTHAKAQTVKKYFIENGWDWDEYFKFCFVRNPWDRAVSNYFYKLRTDFKDKNFSRHCSIMRKQIKNFNEFVSSKFLFNENQTDFFVTNDNQSLVNFIGRFENIDYDFRTICKTIGIPNWKLRKINQTNHKFYKSYYDNESIEVIRSKFRRDIELLGYDF